MGDSDQYSVTASRIHEGMNDAPYVTMTAKRVTMDLSGSLSIEGEGYGRSFSGGTWDGFEVRRLPK